MQPRENLKPMDIIQRKSLINLNTFGMDVHAEEFIYIFSKSQLLEVLENHSYEDINILGGGSNILLTKDLEGLTLKNEIQGIRVISEINNEVLVSVGGGENWHQFVLWTIKNGFGGVENLSLIPGTVGAAPIQNIGAYGVELKDVFVKLEAIDLRTKAPLVFENKDCEFGYRDSIFKRALKGKLFITKVYLKLTKKHNVNIGYGAIRDVLSQWKIKTPTVRDVSKAVIHIRESKLPNPADIGNSGSFFKNPVIEKAQFEKLKSSFPNIVFYSLPNGRVKVPAGWLIEQAGWKGIRRGDAGCHEKQALVLVNYGKAKGAEIYSLAMDILASVKEKFGIDLTPEVNIW